MSNKALNAVWDHSESKGGARLVLLAMADEANDDGLLTAYKRSQSHLARKANVDPATVGRAVKTLEDMGEVAVIQRGTGRDSSDYRLTLPGLGEGTQDADPAPAPRDARPRTMRTQAQHGADPIIPLLPIARPTSPDNVAVVFAAWLDATGRSNRTVLDDKRRRLIVKALDTYPVDDVVDAVRGWQHSAHHRGDNDTRTVYNDLGLLLRDADHIERFRDLARGPSQPARTNGKGPTHRPIMDDRSVASGRIEL
jgi:hypothetical protein